MLQIYETATAHNFSRASAGAFSWWLRSRFHSRTGREKFQEDRALVGGWINEEKKEGPYDTPIRPGYRRRNQGFPFFPPIMTNGIPFSPPGSY